MRGAEHHVTFTIDFMYRNASPAFGFATMLWYRQIFRFIGSLLSFSLSQYVFISHCVCVFFLFSNLHQTHCMTNIEKINIRFNRKIKENTSSNDIMTIIFCDLVAFYTFVQFMSHGFKMVQCGSKFSIYDSKRTIFIMLISVLFEYINRWDMYF